jgi:hypothetical protein
MGGGFRKIVKTLERAAKKAGKDIEQTVVEATTLLTSADELSNAFTYTKNLELNSLQHSADKLDAPQLIRDTPVSESPLKFALSKAISEIDTMLFRNDPLDGASKPHLKLAALLVIYDACKHKNPGLLAEKFPTILSRCISDKEDRLNNSAKVKDFVEQLVSGYTKLDNGFNIQLWGYDIGGDHCFYKAQESKSNITIFTSTGPIIINSPAAITEDTRSIASTIAIATDDSLQEESASATAPDENLVHLAGADILSGPNDVD